MNYEALELWEEPGRPGLLAERDLMNALQVSRTTLWRLRTSGMPYVQVGRQIRYDLEEVQRWLAQSHTASAGVLDPTAGLPPCHWSAATALDPKHRPQQLDAPSTTVRREWWRYPQEAHLLDSGSGRYRRLLASEIAVLQGFDEDWGASTGLGELDLVRGYGDAVPPPLAEVLFRTLREFLSEEPSTIVEICAGFGGLALGASRGLGIEHEALIERWPAACAVLRSSGQWPAEKVREADLREFDWSALQRDVDILSGGPPCQPWSNAGKSRGIQDERDLLGYMPELVERLQPQSFLFENVPGLLTGDNQAYAAWLVERLRNAGADKGYGVAIGTLQPADFGVPQRRRRVFILGLKDTSVSRVHEFFDAVHAKRTHADPRNPLRGRLRWMTVREALPSWDDTTLRWRKWILPPLSQSGSANTIDMRPAQSELPQVPRRIQLNWPSRGSTPCHGEDGWTSCPKPQREDPVEVRPLLLGDERVNPSDNPWLIVGDTAPLLEGLQRVVGRRCHLVYLDVPRIETNAADFAAESGQARLDTWLTLTEALLRSAIRLAADSGVVAALAGIDETPYVQLLLNEIAGPRNHIGTVVWEKNYSPRNMPNMQKISPVHDNLILFARRPEALGRVALRVEPKGFRNPDGDPRGPWNAEQKGANKPDCDYDINLAPYRWSLVGGELPPGIWRISPKSGVIWGPAEEVVESGEWRFTIQVEDQAGVRARRDFVLAVKAEADEPPLAHIPWLIAGPDSSSLENDSGALRIVTDSLPVARVGAAYSAVVLAAGGTPWSGTTRPGKQSSGGKGRYWEFPEKTLLREAALDNVDFKSKDDAIPAIKKHLKPDEQAWLNQKSVWLQQDGETIVIAEDKTNLNDEHLADGVEWPTSPKVYEGAKGSPFAVGYAQEAKKEIEALVSQGIASDTVLGAKPTRLMMRLLALFTPPGGMVVDIGSLSGEMAAAATAVGRRAVYVAFPNATIDELILPRLKLAAKGAHPIPDGIDIQGRTQADDANRTAGYIMPGVARPELASGRVARFEVGEPSVVIDRAAGSVAVDYDRYPAGSSRFFDAIASIDGLVPIEEPAADHFASSLDLTLRAAYIPSDQYLDLNSVDRLLAHHESHMAAGGKLRIYYHRGDPVEPADEHIRLQLRQIPFDLHQAVGLK